MHALVPGELMYLPPAFCADPGQARALLADCDVGELVTATSSGLVATLLPFLFDADAGPGGSLLGHLARSNDQWRRPPVGEALVIMRGPDAYISPAWYASKAEHGRVVPTWNYVTAHVYGSLVVHQDAGWLQDVVRRLTDRHEARRDLPWSVADAPVAFIAGQLRAIVGLEIKISRIEAKVKLSQNKSPQDLEGVIAGLESAGQSATAALMRRARGPALPPR